ncbi:MAG: chemotaxis protein CheB [Xanthomonadales bacterium]|nr:chemotaxis protein CheB [Xanthomonadales bacterium]
MTTRVALLGRDDAVRATLRSALVDAGAELAFEGELQGADADAIRASVAKILIVNLEPGADSELDSLDTLIDDPGIDVLFNEADVTGQLAGWDLARWARHLVAKVLGHGDATPPPPPGAEMLPERNLVPKPGKPHTPAEEVGDSDLSSFADEASASLESLPQSTLPDVLISGQGRAVSAEYDLEEQVAESVPEVDEELPRLDRDAPISAALETASADSSDDFNFDLGEIEQALSAMGEDAGEVVAESAETTSAVTETASSYADLDALGLEAEEIVVATGSDEGLDLESPGEIDLSTDAGLTASEAELSSDQGSGLDLGALDAMLSESSASGQGIESVSIETASIEAASSEAAELEDEPSFAELDLGDIEASLSGIGDDEPAAPTAEAPIDEGMGLEFDFDIDVGSAERSKPSFGDAEVNLEDDADFAALAAQFDAQSESASAEPVAVGLDDIGLRGFDDEADTPVAESAVSLDLDEVIESESPALSSEGDEAGFGSLSLLDIDADIESKEEKSDEKKGGFDFDSLSLSLELEPIESEEGEGEADFIKERKKPAPEIKGIPRIFVLGASIGGPDALRTFISHIPADFPGLFVLAQHLESGFFSRLAHQLQKTSKMLVRVADDGQGPAKVGQLLVVTSAAKFNVDRDGKIHQSNYDKPPHYKPCIDDLFTAAADTFGKDCVAIIFSGMAGDAVEGASHVTAKGGEVWVQDPASCVVSSMVDGAKSRGTVEFSGSPRELAERCVAQFGKA